MNGYFFISYSSKDVDIARMFRNELERAEPIWMAPFSIPVGSSYAYEISRAIEGADAFILLLSNNSVHSKWVEKELDNALRMDIPILPVKINRCELTPSFLFYLSNCQIIEASINYKDAIAQITQMVRGGNVKKSEYDWCQNYRQSILNRLNLTNKVFTLLDMEYSKANMENFLSLNSLLFEYEQFEGKRLDEMTLIDWPCRFIVHGQAGSGKTTLLQNLYYQTAARMIETGVLPFFLQLKNFRLGTLQNLIALYDEINSHLKINLEQGSFVRFISTHKLICFFDGLDEFALDNCELQEELVREIQYFQSQYNCSIVISTRLKRISGISAFDYVLIKPLRQKQIVEFISKYFRYFHIDTRPESFVAQLPRGIQDILSTPLVASMVIASFYKTQHRPSDGNELYNVIIRELLAIKPLLDESQCSVDEKFFILSKLAFEMLLTGRASLPFEAYMEILEREVRNWGNDIDAFDLHKDILHSQVIEVIKNQVSFFHTSVMEFLAHCEINREYNFEAKATMDQYFLKDSEKIKKIVHCISPKATDQIIELGAGIGTVSLALPTYKTLTLVDLDEGLCKILRYNFRKKMNVFVIQEDAIDILVQTKSNKIISNLPFFLTNDVLNILENKDFDCAVMSIRYNDDISFYKRSFLITEIGILEGHDFFPEQPFKSRIIKLIKKS